MATINKKLRNLRPSLRAIAPLTFWISLGFAWTNIAVWWLLSHVPVTAIKQAPVPIVSEHGITYQIWGMWFLVLAIAMIISLVVNSWVWIRRVLIFGLASKLIWSFALLYLIFHGYPVYATLILWAFLAWVQAWTIIYFAPEVEIKNGIVKIARKGAKDK